MLVGTHVSAAGGVDKAPARAAEVGAEVMQIFSRSPRGGKAPELTQQIVADFKAACQEQGIQEVYIHTPYYINFASAKKRIYHGSIEVVGQELERASTLGVKYVMTHLGSANDMSRNKAIKQTIKGIKQVLGSYQGSAQFLIENSAGAGDVIGDKFEEIAKIIEGIETTKKLKGSIGVCYDTCHGFASGYDIRNKQAYKQTMQQFDDLIGLDRLKMFHFNDSKNEFESQKDRHQHIGQGSIGEAGFELILNDKHFKNVNACLETPANEDGDDVSNIKLLKKLRNHK